MIIYHGTSKKNAKKILIEGLKRKKYSTGGFSPIWFAFDINIARKFGKYIFTYETPDVAPDTEGAFSWQITHWSNIPAKDLLLIEPK